MALVDGARHQIDRIEAEAKVAKVEVTVVVDFVHVLEYIWKAAWSFFEVGDPSAEAWVKDKATEVLRSKASVVAGAIRRKATCLGLEPSRRANADTCADYLLAKSKFLDYAAALKKGGLSQPALSKERAGPWWRTEWPSRGPVGAWRGRRQS